jgi:ribose 1,5-bisphosphokinase
MLEPTSPAAVRTPRPGATGRLVLVVGPSGAGKDSIIDWARARIESTDAAGHVRFARRTITRPADAGGERHMAVDSPAFEQLRARGAFALCWSANGLSYGIGQEITTWLDEGCTVVVSGSRAHLPEALRRFPDACVVLVTASPDVLRRRLQGRARESQEQVEARLDRAGALALPTGTEAVEIRNDGLLAEAGHRLLVLLCGEVLPAAPVPASPGDAG